MKFKLCSILLVYSALSYGLSPEEIKKLALEAESMITIHENRKPTGEMKIKAFLKEHGVTNKDDKEKILNMAFDFKENPQLKGELDKDISNRNQGKKNNKDSEQVGLTDKEILSLAKEADIVWQKNGNMGEFAARQYLKTQKNIINKKDLDAVINKVLESHKTKDMDHKSKKSDKTEHINKDSKSAPEIPAEVEKWAQELRNLDPETQTFKIIKKLNEEKVDKGLQGQILIRIRQLRTESSSQPAQDIGSDLQIAKKEQSFYEIEKRSDIQKITTILSVNEKAMIQFIQVVKFKISNSFDLLWQDLVVYFYFTTLERPAEYSKEQIAYDWILKHHMDDVYKVS